MKVQNYWTKQDHTVFRIDRGKQSLNPDVLPQHSFVKPIWNIKFIPPETLKQWVIDKEDVFCYTALGIVPLPKNLIEEAN